MASDAANNDQIADSGAAALGGEMVVAKERVTPSGLRITDLVVAMARKASSGQTVVVNYRGTWRTGKEFDSSYGRAPSPSPSAPAV